MLLLALDTDPLKSPRDPLQAGSAVNCDAQSHHSHPAGAFGKTSTCSFLKQGWEQ